MILPWREVPLGSGTIFTSLTPHEAQKLHDLAFNKRVLEIGSAYGYSAIRMAATARSVLAVDPHEGENVESLERMRANLYRYDPKRKVSILLARSDDAFAALCGAKFDLVFIDGDHSREQVMTDVKNAWGVLEGAGTIACHDYGEDRCPGVQQALDALYPNGPHTLVDTLAIF